MKNIQLLLLGLCILMSACSDRPEYKVSKYLTESEALQFKQSIIRYVASLPKRANDSNKFESRFDEHYRKQLDLVRLDKYYPSKDGYIYFETSRIAPSFKIKRVATAGRLTYNPDGKISEYEEVYRTWKMEEEELAEKTNLLFSRFIAGEDLAHYLTANSDEEYIEFPDHQVKYDKELRRWVGNDLVFQAAPRGLDRTAPEDKN